MKADAERGRERIMANVGKVEVMIEPKLTISEDTAYVLLGLLEMYCRDKNLEVESFLTREEDAAKFEISLNFKEIELEEKEND